MSELSGVRVLFIDDSPIDVELMLHALHDAGVHPVWERVDQETELRSVVADFRPDILFSDFTMPGFSGLEALRIAREILPDVPLVFVSGTIGEDRAIEALKQGATDYILKDNLSRLVPAFFRALQESRNRTQHKYAQRQLAAQYSVARILAEAAGPEESTPRLLQTICEQFEFVVGTLWRVDQGANTLRCVDVWHVPSTALADFASETRKIVSFPSSGLVGRVWEFGEPIWIADALKDPGFLRVTYAAKAGLHAAVAFPIVLHGQITGIMDFFWREKREADAALLDTLHAIGSQIGQVLERQTQQMHIARLNRIHAVLSGINSTIIRVRDRQQLFEEACRIAVEHGKFGIAWIGAYDPQTQEVMPVAWAGIEAEELVNAKSTARSDVPQGQGALGRAIREKKPVVDNNIAAHPDVGSARRQEAIRRGYRSVMVLPLLVEGEVVGILAMFAQEQDFFNGQELELLSELAGDISFALEHIQRQERLNYLSNYDALTGAANRRLLIDRLTQTLAHANRYGYQVAVCFLDLDNFKLVNDSLGHTAGDEMLKIVAARLESCIRNSDTLARLGGDEFVLILPGQTDPASASRVVERVADAITSDSQVVELLERILKTVSEPMELAQQELRLTSTIGVSLYPQDGQDTETLLRNAGAALSRAKQQGRNHFEFYTAELNARVAKRLSLHSELRRAVEQQEFTLYYQPKIAQAAGKLAGVEALIRWNHPTRGLVPPDEFIPALEETGLIIDVGQWVIQEALRDYTRWLSMSPTPPRIAVNVSPLQLRDKDFATRVEQLLKNVSAAPTGLDMEITESLIMQDLETNIPKLVTLRDVGVKIIVDDFGTGYSSLRYLTKLPVSALKIDRAFVRDLQESSDNMAIVTMIISLAKSLRLTVIAEGVETKEQEKILRLLRCDELQGYLISRPLARPQFENWWENYLSKSVD